MKLSEIIIEYRTKHNLSQRDFAKKCELSNGYISMIEKEKNYDTNKKINVTLDSMQKLAKGMNISLDELLKKTDDMVVSLEHNQPISPLQLSAHEIQLIQSYRARPEMQSAVDKLLESPKEELPTIKRQKSHCVSK